MSAPFKPGDRVRLDRWAPSQALDNLGVTEEPAPGAEGYVLNVNDSGIGDTTHQVDVWWDDRGPRGGNKPGRSVLVCIPGDGLSVCGDPHPMIAKITALDDDQLDKELSIARSIFPPGRHLDEFEGWLWFYALEHEKEKRSCS